MNSNTSFDTATYNVARDKKVKFRFSTG